MMHELAYSLYVYSDVSGSIINLRILTPNALLKHTSCISSYEEISILLEAEYTRIYMAMLDTVARSVLSCKYNHFHTSY